MKNVDSDDCSYIYIYIYMDDMYYIIIDGIENHEVLIYPQQIHEINTLLKQVYEVEDIHKPYVSQYHYAVTHACMYVYISIYMFIFIRTRANPSNNLRST